MKRFDLTPDFDTPNKLYIYDNFNGRSVWAVVFGQVGLAAMVCDYLNRVTSEHPLIKD